jgi:hypothetical protein
MTPSIGGGYGLARSNAQLWSDGDVMVSANQWTSAPTNSTSSAVVASPGAGKYLKVWGIQMMQAVDPATLCNIAASSTDGNNEEMVLGVVASRLGPVTMNFPVPIKLSANQGVEVNWVSVGSGAKCMINIVYTVHDE